MSVIILILVPLCVHDVPFFFPFSGYLPDFSIFLFSVFHTQYARGCACVCVVCVWCSHSQLAARHSGSISSKLFATWYVQACRGWRAFSVMIKSHPFFFFFFLSLILNWALCPWYLDVWPSQCSCPFPVSFWAQYAFNPHYNSMCLL